MKWTTVTVALTIIFGKFALNTAVKNVLVIDGVGSPSHQVWMHRLTRAVANHGYNVTALSCKVHANPPPSLHSYHIETVYSGLEEEHFDFMEMGSMGTWEKFFMFSSFLSLMDELVVTSNGLKQIMAFPKDFKFDLIIFDYLSPLSLLVLADRFPEASLIGASAYPAIEYTNTVTKAPNFSPFVPNLYKDNVDDSFLSRLDSFLIYMVDYYNVRYIHFPSSQKTVNKYYKTSKSLSELYASTKIQLVNYHPVLDFVQPIMPGVIPVGGLQVSERNPLPDDIQKIFDIPSKGVILFSLGSNVKCEQLGEARLKEVIRTLAEISDYTFIWKIDLTGFTLEIPKNVFIKMWLPQNDILAQNKTVLFISHAGGLSTQESTWYGVPMLALPVMFDQYPVRGLFCTFFVTTNNKNSQSFRMLRKRSQPVWP